MISDDSDSTWEKLGKINPYYGVLGEEKFRNENLNEEARNEFFRTGETHIDRVLEKAFRYFGKLKHQDAALDFGCGVGRLVIPLAQKFSYVTGVDVSSSMLSEAKNNCAARGIDNITFVQSDDELSNVTRHYDFIHSYIVLQHIPVRRGQHIISRLLAHLNSEGVLALHVPIMRKSSTLRKVVNLARKYFSPLSIFVNLVQGSKWNEPFMQMNSYDVNNILIILFEHGIQDVFIEIIDSGGYLQAFIFAKKN